MTPPGDASAAHDAPASLSDAERERLRARAVAAASAGIVILDVRRPGHPIVDCNPAFERLTGYPSEEALGRNCDLLVGPETDPAAFEAVQRALDEGRACDVTLRCYRKDGTAYWNALSLFPLPDGDHGSTHMVGTLRDVSERKHAEAALAAAERNTSRILESITAGFFALDADARFTFVNPHAERLLRRRKDDLIGLGLWDAFPGARELSFFERYETARTSGRSVRFEAYYPPLETWFSVTIYPFAEGASVYFQDITQRRRLEQEVTRISEEERQRFGRELHDRIGSLLSGIAMMNGGLAGALRAGHAVEADELDRIAEVAAEGVRQSRALAKGLNPVALVEEGLEAALEELEHLAWTTARIPCTFEQRGAPHELPGNVRSHLYWIAHEAVHNALKHAGASRIRVELAYAPDSLTLTVADNGSGLPGAPEDAPGEGHLGLRLMRHRANMIGGTLRLEAARGGGTVVACVVPAHTSRTP